MEGTLRDPALRLIETFRWDGAALVRLEAHLARARASAMALGFSWKTDEVDHALATVSGPSPQRVRLTIGRNGDADLTAAPLPPAASKWRIAIHAEPIDERHPARGHKTTDRALYDQARAALPEGVDEYLFLNRRGELAEGTITNLFADLGDGLVTPPLASGCLPGVLRAELLASGQAREAALTPDMLKSARLWVGNSLRGLIPGSL
ncbi:aminotransferase class IV family protein [Frigidibacter sp. RF13]|uniref:aminotransferase class IV family protein n=1 Tax=Frigidibacter sp. RF13 TaxID=2997340 RepID=UPI00226FABE2|nr:aminotransferase class IV family protein [Frigidibacter sp. RF13]MCY1127337.1 aminotransferase class IV family protein [Frigidibacter sp. RF13]